jgi:hypothetical protein
MVIKTICFLILFSTINSELAQIVTLCRHGSRYALNDQYDGNESFPMWGELTGVGMRQHYNLGQVYRRKFIEEVPFLKPSYNHSQVEVHSTIANRAIDSITSQLQGLFPSTTGPKIPEGISSQLLVPPFKYSDDAGNISNGYALPSGRQLIGFNTGGVMKTCGNLDALQKYNLQQAHATVDEMNSRYGPFLDSIKATFNLTQPLDIVNMSDLYDTLTVDRFLGKQIPLSESDYGNLQHLQYFTYLLKFGGKLQLAITTPKFQRMISAFDAKIGNSSGLLRWVFLSGHDTEIYPSLNVLNISSSSCIEELYRFNKTNALNCEPGPEYAATLQYELHNEAAGYEVRLRYNGKYVNLCERKQTACPYPEFKKRIEADYVDVQSICGP